MATIKTALALYDGMTGPLRNITTAMNILINSFESCQRASRNAIDISSLQTAREQLAQADMAFESIEASAKGAGDAIKTADTAQKQLNRDIATGSTHAGDLIGKLRSMAVVAAGIKLAKFAIGQSDTLTNTTARLNLIVDDGGSVAELQDKIMASATRARADYLDTADAIAKMGANAGSAFSGNDEMIAFMEQVNKQFVIGGATAEGQSAAMLQLTQAMAAGALRGEELNSILENAPGIARAIESYMGIAEGSIKNYAQEGKVTAEVVKNALFATAEETNAKFESMPMTFAQIWTNIKNQALMAFQPILEKLNQIANSERFQSFVQGIITAVQQAANLFTSLFNIVINIVGWFAEMGFIEPLIWGIAAALAAWTVATLAQKAATVVMTIAQNGLNASFLACPITWVVLAVAALAAGIAYLAKKVGGFGVLWNYVCAAMQVGWSVTSNTVMSGIEWMVYGFMWLYDKACWCWDAISIAFMQVWDAIATAFESVLSGFLNGIQNLVNWCIEMLNGVIKAYNAVAQIWGGQVDLIDQTGFADDYSSWAHKQQVQRHNDITAAQIGAEQSSFHRQADLIDQANKASATFNQGIEDAARIWGDAVAYEQEIKAKQEAATSGTGGAGSAYDSIYNNVQSIDENTADIADSLAVSETELKYLREIAERQAINKFTTAEIKVEMTNHNTISGEQDIDGIMEQLTEKVNEAMIVASEGVHV